MIGISIIGKRFSQQSKTAKRMVSSTRANSSWKKGPQGKMSSKSLDAPGGCGNSATGCIPYDDDGRRSSGVPPSQPRFCTAYCKSACMHVPISQINISAQMHVVSCQQCFKKCCQAASMHTSPLLVKTVAHCRGSAYNLLCKSTTWHADTKACFTGILSLGNLR